MSDALMKGAEEEDLYWRARQMMTKDGVQEVGNYYRNQTFLSHEIMAIMKMAL